MEMVNLRVACSFVAEVFVLLLRIIYCYAESLYRFVVPTRQKDIRGNVTVVTGGGSGIGRALATRFADRGACVAVWDINTDGADETVSIIRSNGGVARAYTCDVSKVDDVAEMARQVRAHMGDVEMVVNNAGCCSCRHLLELSESDIRRTFDVNVLAHFWTVREFLPAMITRNSGHIVTVASMSSRGGHTMLTDYCASKYASFGFTEALAEEMRQVGATGVHTTTVCPLFVDTNMVRRMNERVVLTNRFDDGRLLTVDEVAETTVADVLRNKRYVYIPRIAGFAGMQDFMPEKVKIYLNDFVGIGFHPVEKKAK